MTQVSKRQLGKNLEEKVYTTFWSTVAMIDKEDEAAAFFNELFTKAERINFAKRLSIAILLYKGYDWRQIRDILKVSVGTIAKISNKVNNEGFGVYFAKIERAQKWQEFWKDLAKAYLTFTHPEKVARLGDEGVEKVYLKSKKKTLF